MDSIYKCPVCGQKLKSEGRVLRCGKNHSYDIASEGYVNLILANQKRSQDPGDDRGMVQNRAHFLGQGYYNPLSDRLNGLISGFMEESKGHDGDFGILDVGCGEGYYAERLLESLGKLNPRGRFQIWGIDVSRSAIQRAAKRSRQIQWCVGNSYRLPYLDESVDVAFSVFSPFDPKELLRVLRPGGKIIVVRPGPGHLGELATLLYGKFELQGDSSKLPAAFDRQPIAEDVMSYEIQLKSNKDIESLVGMTPYFWSLGDEKRAAMAQIDSLKVTADFYWSVFQK